MQLPGRNAQTSLRDARTALEEGMGTARRGRKSLRELRDRERELLQKWAGNQGRCFKEDPSLSLGRRQGHGEHVVSFDPETRCWWKTTHPGKSGVGAEFHYSDLPPFSIHSLSARELLPSEYLDRLILHNEEFGDDIRLEGYITGDLPSLLISQPDISGTPATRGQMEQQMRNFGYLILPEIYLGKPNSISFYQPIRRIAFFDAHPGNFFCFGDVTLPIDGIIMHVDRNPEHDWLMKQISPVI